MRSIPKTKVFCINCKYYSQEGFRYAECMHPFAESRSRAGDNYYSPTEKHDLVIDRELCRDKNKNNDCSGYTPMKTLWDRIWRWIG